jgi:integrase
VACELAGLVGRGHASRLQTRLERDAFPAFGKVDLRSVTSADVLAMVRSVEARGALAVSRGLKQHVSQIYRFAIPQGWADKDPAEHLSNLLKPKPRTKHMAKVGMDELPHLVCAIDCYDGDETRKRRAITRGTLLFTLLTWARTNETRLATWDEFEGLDTPDPIWRVPAARMKMEREHIVPLASAVVALLGEMRKLRLRMLQAWADTVMRMIDVVPDQDAASRTKTPLQSLRGALLKAYS